MLYADPGKLSNAVRRTQGLLRYDALITPFDPTLEMEALGASVVWGTEKENDYAPPRLAENSNANVTAQISEDTSSFLRAGRIPVILEVVKRLKSFNVDRVPVFAYLTGPLTLACQILRSDPKSALVKDERKLDEVVDLEINIVRSMCENGITGLLVAEGDLSALDRRDLDSYERAISPIWNLVEYYQTKQVLVVERGNRLAIDFARIVPHSVVVCDINLDDIETIAVITQELDKCLGLPLPAEILDRPKVVRAIMDKIRAGFQDSLRNLFVTTSSPMVMDLDVARAKESIEVVHNITSLPT